MIELARLRLTDEEVDQVSDLLEQLASTYSSAEDPEFIERAAVLSHNLPARICFFLNDFKYNEDGPSIALISGYPIDESKIGPTPLIPLARSDSKRTQKEQMLLVLYGSLLGDVFGWSTQQAGYLIHDVFPASVHENDQLGFGSKQMLTWHVEDSFHPFRGDYLGLFCIRNPARVPTMVASITDVRLDHETLNLLFESRYSIRPDESHLSKNRQIASGDQIDPEYLDDAYERMERMNVDPPKISILFGDRASPYLRIDPYFMDPLTNDPDAQSALNKLIDQIESNISDLVLEGGDCVFLDNFRTVHGRRPFSANYDGKDRWLKRVNVTRDLRKSREMRINGKSRIIV